MASEKPSCFGFWEAIGTSVCVSCGIKDECLHKLAMEVLPARRKEMEVAGTAFTAAAMAAELGMTQPEAIAAAMEYATQHGAVAEKPKAPGKTPAPTQEKVEAAQQKAVAAMDSADAIPPPPVASAPTAPMPPPPVLDTESPEPIACESPAEPESVEQEESVPKEKKTRKKKSAEKPAEKETPKKKGKKAASHPLRASVAKRASALASKVRRSAPVATAQARVSKRRIKRREWGEETWEARHQRERERCRDFAHLTPGMKLRPTYKGQEYLVQVDSYGYRYQDQRYPTLYAVMVEILGTYKVPQEGSKIRTPSWSAPKFFRASIQKVLKRSKTATAKDT